MTDRGSMVTATPELWDRLHAVNAKTPFFLMQRAIADMRARKQPGAIVNILSINVHGGATDLTVYSASKAALALVTKNAAHAHRFDRIRINGINMGWADTPAERVMHADTLGKGPAWLAEQAAQQPFGRLLVAEDVARLTHFLLSPASEPMTGAPAWLRPFAHPHRLRPYRCRCVPPLPSGRIHRGRAGGWCR
jgi:NAD(P)-dependent dehydrogenase (short-subunit alcohol dehydrogenase family)